MFWKKKKESTEICGYLDVNKKFYVNKEERDKVNRDIQYKKEISTLTNRFNAIINWIYEHSGSLRYYDLKKLPDIAPEMKIELLKVFAEYLQLEEKWKKI